MKIHLTQRGFGRADFKDRYSQSCSIQESSLADEPCIWLGCDLDIERQPSSRMHLTQDMARELIPLLEFFVKHGGLE